MTDHESQRSISRRELLESVGKSMAAIAVAHPVLRTAILPTSGRTARATAAVNGVAGVDRVVVLPGKTYLRGWAGY